jgi:uncharacterized membrane protein
VLADAEFEDADKFKKCRSRSPIIAIQTYDKVCITSLSIFTVLYTEICQLVVIKWTIRTARAQGVWPTQPTLVIVPGIIAP